MWSVDKRQLNAACLQYRSCLPDRQSRTTAPVLIKQTVKQPYSGRRRQALFVKLSATGQETPARLHGNFPTDHDGGNEQRGTVRTAHDLVSKKQNKKTKRNKKNKNRRESQTNKNQQVLNWLCWCYNHPNATEVIYCLINTCSLLRLEGKMLTSLTLPCEIKKCFGKPND